MLALSCKYLAIRDFKCLVFSNFFFDPDLILILNLKSKTPGRRLSTSLTNFVACNEVFELLRPLQTTSSQGSPTVSLDETFPKSF